MTAASDTTSGVWDRVFSVYWPIGLAVLVIVWGLVAFLVIRYRARGAADEIPQGTDEKTPVEVAYAVVLAFIAAFLIWFTLNANSDLNAQFNQPAAVQVKVTGSRWNWRFEYPKLGVVEQGTRDGFPTLTVPAGEPVDFRAISLDVIHSFWIPDERFKRDVFPHRHTTWQMTFDTPEVLAGAGHCAEFCGLHHAEMRFNVRVLPPNEFDAWAHRHEVSKAAGRGSGVAT